jgi:hypothetical protein
MPRHKAADPEGEAGDAGIGSGWHPPNLGEREAGCEHQSGSTPDQTLW